MHRSGVLVLLGVAVLGLVGLLATALADERRTAFTLGVGPAGVAADLAPGDRACQVPVRVAEDFTHVSFLVGTYERPGQPLDVSIRSEGAVSRGRLEGGYGDGLAHLVRIGDVGQGHAVSVCIRNAGRRRVAIYGGTGAAARLSTATINGRDTGTDLALVFEREPRSALSMLPDVFEHASRFRPAWLATWLFWTLSILVLVAVPLALAMALRKGVLDDERGAPAPERAREHVETARTPSESRSSGRPAATEPNRG
jgi:hypothetical protein